MNGVSIIIATMATPARLEVLDLALDSMMELDYPDFEICIANDGGESLNPLLEKYGGRGIILNQVEGCWGNSGGARNAAMKLATKEWLAITDDDCLVDPYWLTNLFGYLNPSEPYMISGKTIDAGNWYSNIGQIWGDYLMEYYKGRFIATNNMGLPRWLALEIGGMRDFFYSEDRDFAYRLHEYGAEYVFQENAVVRHLKGSGNMGFKDTMIQFYQYGIGSWVYRSYKKTGFEPLSFYINHVLYPLRAGYGILEMLMMVCTRFAHMVGYYDGRRKRIRWSQ